MTNPAQTNSRWKYWLAVALLFGFISQSLLRVLFLWQIIPSGRLGVPTAPLVHAMSLIVIGLVAGATLASVKKRKLWQLVVALMLATIGIMFIVFDVVATMTLPVILQVMPLNSISEFYCSNDRIFSCLETYWQQTALIVGVLVGWTMLIWISADQLARIVQSAWRRIVCAVGNRKSRIGVIPLVLGYAASWMIFPNFVGQREIVFKFYSESPTNYGPVKLLWGGRPDFSPALSPSVRPRTLVLVTVDSFRSDAVELSPEKPSLTPFLQSLARTGKLHDLGPATAICPYSYCGIIGLQSSKHWAALENGPPLMLADILAANSYRSYFLLGGRHKTHKNLGQVYGPKVTKLLDDSSSDSNDIADDREQVRRLRQLKLVDPHRTFLSIHLMSAHAAGLRFNRAELSSSRLEGVFRSMNMKSMEYRDRYNDGVRQADEIIRDLFAELKRKDLLDDALIVITGDHGERIGDGEQLGHGIPIDTATSAIPLLIYDTRSYAWPTQIVASQIDVAPTLLAAVNIAQPSSFIGAPLQHKIVRLAAPIDSGNSTGMVSVINGERVLFRCNLSTGRTDLLHFGSIPLSAKQQDQAYSQSSALYGELLKRSDAERCFKTKTAK